MRWRKFFSDNLEIVKSRPKVYIDGREVGTITSDSLSAEPNPEHVNYEPFSGSFSFSIKSDDNETAEKMKAFVAKCRADYFRSLDKWIGECMRTRVVPPIKGKVTVGKVRWRGLELCFGPDNAFYGILQRRRTLYCIDGNTYTKPTKPNEE